MPRNMLGVHSSNSSTKCHVDQTDCEENVALLPPTTIDETNLLSPQCRGRRTPSPSPQQSGDKGGRPRAKSLFGSGSTSNSSNRQHAHLQLSPPSLTVMSSSAEKIDGHWSDQVMSTGESGQEDHHAIIFDDHLYEPGKLGLNAGPERPRRKSFAREALDLFYGLNPPPRTLSVADFCDAAEGKSLSNRQLDKELKKSRNKDLNSLKSPNNISSPVSDNVKWGSGKNSHVFDNFDEQPRSPFPDVNTPAKSDEKVSANKFPSRNIFFFFTHSRSSSVSISLYTSKTQYSHLNCQSSRTLKRSPSSSSIQL